MDNINDNIFGLEETIEPDNGQFEETQEEENAVEEEETQETTEETESPESGQEEVTEDKPGQKPELIAGKFKTQEDLIQAYNNLQAEYTRLRQAQKAAPKEEQPQEKQVSEEEQLMAWYNQAVQQDPAYANAVLSSYMAKKQFEQYKQELEQQFTPIVKERETQQEVQKVAQKYPDIAEYSEGIQQEFMKDPSLYENPNRLEIAYLRAKQTKLAEQLQTAFTNGKKAATQNISQKKKIINETSTASTDETIPEGLNIIEEGDGIFI
ncbi:MAG: hypothetical protein PWP31_1810 [Clostridia bacterium]|jgi:hypothetical protein|nr:hypothetical protein [Clostridia bacterium]